MTRPKISEKQLTDFLPSIGAAIRESSSFLGRFSEGKNHLWIFIAHEELEYLTTTKREAIVQCLQDEPRTCIVLELSSTRRIERLVIQFATAFAAHWPCAICDFIEGTKIYAIQQESVQTFRSSSHP